MTLERRKFSCLKTFEQAHKIVREFFLMHFSDLIVDHFSVMQQQLSCSLEKLWSP